MYTLPARRKKGSSEDASQQAHELPLTSTGLPPNEEEIYKTLEEVTILSPTIFIVCGIATAEAFNVDSVQIEHFFCAT